MKNIVVLIIHLVFLSYLPLYGQEEKIFKEYDVLIAERVINISEIYLKTKQLVSEVHNVIGEGKSKSFYRKDYDAFCLCDECKEPSKQTFILSKVKKGFSIYFLGDEEGTWITFNVFYNSELDLYLSFFEKRFLNKSNHIVIDFIARRELQKQFPGILKPSYIIDEKHLSFVDKFTRDFLEKTKSESFESD